MAGLSTRRLVLEGLAIPGSALVAWGVLRFDLAATAVVTATVVVVLVLAHLLPGDDYTAWPQLPAPERGGRRAEIYRLSWQLDAGTSAGPYLVRRLVELAERLEPDATPAERDALRAALAPLLPTTPPTGGRRRRSGTDPTADVARAVDRIERTLAAIEQRADTSPSHDQRRPR
ncbi:hypothetical protein EDD28_2138 [Salana multivorans]|uniref:Uncharacterized protein n=1 Tax=Salana multivorans TaxID=120377 RepID=A0A3N2DCZ9_9MICO|nr:hypothetical protein [Salana multivorans]ROR97538.1 hypothetical protein EDD28_2138 [Salana multivorans]